MAAKASGEWFRVARNDAKEIDIDIYGDIGETTDWWTGEKEGLGAKAFLDELRAAGGKAVNLHVNSGGGSVIDAYAMMTAIRDHDGKVTAYVDGLAASAASFLVAAADEVVMSSVAWMMIHRSSSVAWGNAADLREQAAYLEKIDAQLAGVYAKRSGVLGEGDFLAAMDETTWFTADEAVEWGLADRVVEAVAAAACYTSDPATRDSAPAAARAIIRSGLARAFGDTSENMPADGDGADGQEPARAQERAVAVGGKLLMVRGGNIEKQGKGA